MMEIIVFEDLLPDIFFCINLALAPCFLNVFGSFKIFNLFKEILKISTILHFLQVLVFVESAAEDQVGFKVNNSLSECCTVDLFLVHQDPESVAQTLPVAGM